MKKKPVDIFAFVSIVLLLFLILWFAGRAFNSRHNQVTDAESHFGELRRIVPSSFLAGGSFGSPHFSRTISAEFAQQTQILALAVFSTDKELEYVYTRDGRFLDAWREGQVGPDSINQVTLVAPVALDKDRSVQVRAIYRVFSRGDVFPILREVLVALLVYLVLTVVFLATSAARAGRREENSQASPAAGTSELSSSSQAPEHPLVESPAAGDHRPSVGEGIAESPIPADPPAGARGTTKNRTAPVDDPSEAESVEESGSMYSTESELGWERFLEERLGSELKRAASFDQDLALMIAEIPGVSRGHPAYRALAGQVRVFFNFRDLCFEYGDSGFAVIIPNVDLDQGLDRVEAFRSKIHTALESNPVVAPGQSYFGVSARNGRLLSGARLLKEATSALARSRRENSPIVAFRVDPEKYRSYIAGRTQMES